MYECTCNYPTMKVLIGTIIVLVCFRTSTDAAPARCDPTLEDQNLPDDSDCFKYFRCVYGRKVPKICPDKMVFNAEIGNCDLYYNVVDCPLNSIDDSQEIADAIQAYTSYVPTTPPSSSFFPLERDETTTLKFVYVPHETDERAYYKIERGARLLLFCDEGKVFSFDLEVCARKWTT